MRSYAVQTSKQIRKRPVMNNNQEIQKRKDATIAHGVGMMTPIYAERAENAAIWDVEGNRYIDFSAGIAVVNTGHRHPKVIEVVKAQLDRFTHTCHQDCIRPIGAYLHLRLAGGGALTSLVKA